MSTVNASPLRNTVLVSPETAQARPSMFSTLRVVNNSQYDILRASIDGHSLLNPTMLLGPSPTIPPGASRNFYVTSALTQAWVELSAGLSWGTEMVRTYGDWVNLTAGLTTVFTFPRITLGQLFNRGDRPWAFFGGFVAIQPGHSGYQEVIYTFDRDGEWAASVEGGTNQYGSLLEVSWPDFATNVWFKLRTMDFPISIRPYCPITSFFMWAGGTYVLFTPRRSGW